MKLFSRLFKKNNFKEYGLVNLQDLVSVPLDNFYREHLNEYKRYYKEYSDVLGGKNSITSLDIILDEEIDINFYSNMITKLTLDLSYIINPINQSSHRNKFGFKVIALKLKFYQHEMENYRDNLCIKWKVLQDILDKKLFLLGGKRNAVKNEINNIIGKIVVLSNYIHAINLEIINYYEMMSLYELNDDFDYVNRKIKNLNDYLKVFNLKRNFKKTITDVVAMEIILEKYIVRNNVIKSLEEEINDLNEDKINFEIVNILITKAKCIRDLFDREKGEVWLKKLYEAKYNLLKSTYKKNITVKDSVFKYYSEEEIKYLTNYLQKDIDSIFRDDFENIKKVYQNNKRFVLHILKKIITNSQGKIILENLLYDNLALSFIFNIDNLDNLRYLFDNTRVNQYCGKKKMSLANFAMMLYCQTSVKKEHYKAYVQKTQDTFKSYGDCLKDATKELDRNKYSSYMFFYKKILDDENVFYAFNLENKKNLLKGHFQSFEDYNEYLNICELFERNKVYFPESIRKSDLYYPDCRISNLYLNDGLEELVCWAVGYIYQLFIPSSVQNIKGVLGSVSKFIFEDYENSKLFNDKEKFILFLTDIYKDQMEKLNAHRMIAPKKICLKSLSDNKEFIYEIECASNISLVKQAEMLYDKMVDDLKPSFTLRR